MARWQKAMNTLYTNFKIKCINFYFHLSTFSVFILYLYYCFFLHSLLDSLLTTKIKKLI